MSGSTSTNRLSMMRTGMALSLLFATSFLACVAWGLVTPWPMHMHEAWTPLLPGFVWLTPAGFLIGLIESYLYGWWISVVFVPIYNRF
ncbi:MAG: hypothetical protein COA47_01850 [Robiginitomaculum sp.]|nr:MAG: hypothetical protein COA47_01850 [Robiginitomaculum sp.]